MRLLLPRLIVCFFIAVTVQATVALAQDLPSFVYINDDMTNSNTVSGFRVMGDGSLMAVPGSPFPTGGIGTQSGGFFASNMIVISGKFLYAVNNEFLAGVSGFVINEATGELTLVPGSPYGIGGGGFSLATTPDNAFLIAGSDKTPNLLTVFSIDQTTGALTEVPGSPFSAGGSRIVGMKVTPNGKFLAIANTHGVEMFSIAASGAVSRLSGSPFPAGNAASVEFNCRSSLLFSGGFNNYGTIVNVMNVGAAGALTHISGSPFIFPAMGANSNVAILDPKDKFLFVSNQDSVTVSVFNVATNGNLTPVTGSPFPVPLDEFGYPTGMATTRNGSFLFVANHNRFVAGLSVSVTGALTPVSGGRTTTPFSKAKSIAVYPPKRCHED